jgi:hypothetical protein
VTIYDDKYDAEMVALYPRLSTTELAKKFGFTRNAVVRHLRRNGVKVRPRGTPPFSQKLPPGELEKTVNLRKAGLTYKEIGKELGLPWQTIRERLRRAGITGKQYDQRHRRRKTENLDNALATRSVQALGQGSTVHGSVGLNGRRLVVNDRGRGPTQVKIRLDNREGMLTWKNLDGSRSAETGTLRSLNVRAALLYYIRLGEKFYIHIAGHKKAHQLWYDDETAEKIILNVVSFKNENRKCVDYLKRLRAQRPENAARRAYNQSRKQDG